MSCNKIVRKSFVAFIFCFILPLTMSGQRNQLPRLDRAKVSISSILRNLKYDTSLHDGIIMFSDGQRSYSLECTEESESMFFGKISTYFDYDEVVTYPKVAQFTLNHNFKVTKIVQNDDTFSLRSEFYFSDPDFVYESVGLFLSTFRKAESMLKAYCQTSTDEKAVSIDSLQVHFEADSIPRVRGAFVIDSRNSIGDTVAVKVRVYCNNTLIINSHSPEGFSLIDRIVIENTHQNCTLTSFEIDVNHLNNPNIRYELWDERDRYLCSLTVNQ